MKRILYILMSLVALTAVVCLAAPQVPVPKPTTPTPTPKTRRCNQCGNKKSLDAFNGSSIICWSCAEDNERAEAERKRQEEERDRQEAERQRQVEAERQRREQEERNRFVDKTYAVNGVSFTMIAVKGGTFTMGATAEQGSDAESDENPAHSVTVSDYYIGQTEVTEGLWRTVMGSNPSAHKRGDNYPVENVSWEDCQMFIRKLNLITGETFRLPTEAEWEFAARGGTMSRGYKYSGSIAVSIIAWYYYNSGNEKNLVATTPANDLDLYDMSGNVWEWCQDWYDKDYYGKSPSSNPTGPSTGSYRVLRGGGWANSAEYCRVSNRNSGWPSWGESDRGLRLAR